MQVVELMASAEQWLKLWEDAIHHHHHDDQQQSMHAADHHQESREKKPPGHHGKEVNKYLQKHLSRLTDDRDGLSVFVTLCGNSPDLAWLCEKGYEVVGCELSARAVEQLFENRKIEYEVKEEGEVKVFSATDGKKLKVYVGDFFGALNPGMTGTFDCIWDCYGITSVPPSLQVQYAEKIAKFLKPGGRMLFSTLKCDDKKPGSGPAPVSVSRIIELFPNFKVELIENPESPAWISRKFGGGNWTNPVTILTLN